MKKNNSTGFDSVISLVTILIATIHLPATALEFTAVIGTSVEHSDNVNRADEVVPSDIVLPLDNNGPRSDVESQIRLDLGLTGSTAQFDTELAYAFLARDFKNDVQTDDEVVDGNARILWTPLPDRFSWELTHNISDTVRDDLLADTPDNREQRNILSTGPNFIFRVSPVDRISAEYRYVDVEVEDSRDGDGIIGATQQDGSDSERHIGRLRWSHSLSTISDFLVNVEYEDVEAIFDVTYTRLLLGYAARLRNGSYAIYLGSNKVQPSIGDDFDTPVFQAAISQDLGGHIFDITLIQEATDTSLGLGASELRSETFTPRDSNFDAFDIIKRKRADVVYQNFLICGGACSIRASAYFDDQDYQSEPIAPVARIQTGDQTNYGLTLGVVYSLNNRVDLLATAIYDVNEFLDNPDELKFESKDYQLGMNWEVVRNFSVGLQVSQSNRDANIEGLDFDELRGGINLSYTF